MKGNHRKCRVLDAILVLALIGSLDGAAFASARNAQDCQALRNHAMDGAYVTSARIIADHNRGHPGGIL